MVRQLYLYSIEAADFPDSVTSENTLREFPLVIATVAKVSRKQRTFCIRNCSVPSQLRAKIHFKSASPMGFLPSSLCFITVSAASAQTY